MYIIIYIYVLWFITSLKPYHLRCISSRTSLLEASPGAAPAAAVTGVGHVGHVRRRGAGAAALQPAAEAQGAATTAGAMAHPGYGGYGLVEGNI